MEIIPAIMPESFIDLQNKMAQVVGSVKIVQLDLMDGIFVKPKTFPFFPKDAADMTRIIDEEAGLPYWEELDVELDLMVQNAHESLGTFLSLGAKRIIFHIEAEGQINEFKEFLEGIDLYTRENVEIGVAVNNDTPIENIFPLIPFVSFVQCMGIARIGYQGEEFDERVVTRVETLREKFPDLTISVDGSVNEETLPILMKAGVDRFVIGSAIFSDIDPASKVKEFQDML